jgi:hypothetical protein
MGCCASCCTREDREHQPVLRSPQPRHSRGASPQIAPIRSNIIFVQQQQQYQREPSKDLPPQQSEPHRNCIPPQPSRSNSSGSGASPPLHRTPSDVTLHTVSSLTASTTTTSITPSSLRQQPHVFQQDPRMTSPQHVSPQNGPLQRRVSFDLRSPSSKRVGKLPSSNGERPSAPSPLRPPPPRLAENETIEEHSLIITDY